MRRKDIHTRNDELHAQRVCQKDKIAIRKTNLNAGLCYSGIICLVFEIQYSFAQRYQRWLSYGFELPDLLE